MNITRKRCNSNDTDLCCTQVTRELHAKSGAQRASCCSAAPRDVRMRRGLPVRVAFTLGRVAFRPNHRYPPGTEAAPPNSAMPDTGPVWGFCTIRSTVSACRRRVAALMVQFPPFAGGAIVRQVTPLLGPRVVPFHRLLAPSTSADLPKTQTTLPTKAHFQRLSPRWSTFWAPHPRESWLAHG